MEKMIYRLKWLDKAVKSEVEKRIAQLEKGLITSEEFLFFCGNISDKQNKLKEFIFETALKAKK